MLSDLKTRVHRANLDLLEHGLVIFTWGNASGIDRDKNLVVIKPSGVPYNEMEPGDMVVMDLDGSVVEGSLNPSSDAATHLELYRQFHWIGGVVHTHSEWATSWAQAGKPIPPFGTTHADHFRGEIPCTRSLTPDEVEHEYELNTGRLIAETFRNLDASAMPGVLVRGHGPFSWGTDVDEAVHHAAVLENIAKMAFRTLLLGNDRPVGEYLLDKHYLRKHGKNAYYGQK